MARLIRHTGEDLTNPIPKLSSHITRLLNALLMTLSKATHTPSTLSFSLKTNRSMCQEHRETEVPCCSRLYTPTMTDRALVRFNPYTTAAASRSLVRSSRALTRRPFPAHPARILAPPDATTDRNTQSTQPAPRPQPASVDVGSITAFPPRRHRPVNFPVHFALHTYDES